MKFSALTGLLLLFFAVPAFTQLQLAPLAGLNISKIRTSKSADPGFSYLNTNGFMGGLNTKYAFDDRCNVQLEGAFSQKGYEVQAKNEPDRIAIHLNYLDLLLLGEYLVNDIIALNFGGNFGTKIGGNINGSKDVIPEVFNGKDIGLIAGMKFYIGQLFIRTTYQHGVNALDSLIITDENGMTTGLTNEFNQTFQVAVGYYFSEP